LKGPGYMRFIFPGASRSSHIAGRRALRLAGGSEQCYSSAYNAHHAHDRRKQTSARIGQREGPNLDYQTHGTVNVLSALLLSPVLELGLLSFFCCAELLIVRSFHSILSRCCCCCLLRSSPWPCLMLIFKSSSDDSLFTDIP